MLTFLSAVGTRVNIRSGILMADISFCIRFQAGSGARSVRSKLFPVVVWKKMIQMHINIMEMLQDDFFNYYVLSFNILIKAVWPKRQYNKII